MSKLTYNNPKVFKASGDMGDVVYTLMYMNAVGANKLILDPNDGKDYGFRDGYIHKYSSKFNKDKAEFLFPFLSSQVETEWNVGQPYDCWINETAEGGGSNNITECHANKFNLNWKDLKSGWLKPYSENKIKRLIVNRTHRYRGNNVAFYDKKIKEFDGEVLFLGLKEEYDDFPYKIPFQQVKDGLEMASIISSSTNCIANGSLTMAMAIGFGLEVDYEWAYGCAHYLFDDSKVKIWQ